MLEQPAATALASCCTSIGWNALNADVQEHTKELLLDHLGVTVRGSGEASSTPVVEFVQGVQAGGPSSVVGAGFARLRPGLRWPMAQRPTPLRWMM